MAQGLGRILAVTLVPPSVDPPTTHRVMELPYDDECSFAARNRTNNDIADFHTESDHDSQTLGNGLLLNFYFQAIHTYSNFSDIYFERKNQVRQHTTDSEFFPSLN